MQFKPFYCTQSQLNNNKESVAIAGRLIICTDSKSIYFCPSDGSIILIGKASEATSSEAGLMTSTMVDKLSNISENATFNSASNTLPKVASAAPTTGTEIDYARGDHVHPVQTTISGNAGSADKLSTDKTFSLFGDATGSVVSDLENGFSINNVKIKTMVGYGICTTGSEVSEKIVTVSDNNWKREVGSLIAVKFAHSNTASNVTLNINNTGAAGIIYGTLVSEYPGHSTDYCGAANRSTLYMWDGTYWMFIANSFIENNDTYTSAYCDTSGGVAEKHATMTDYSILDNSYLYITMVNTNSAATTLTLNINDTESKPIYINGLISSNVNYNLNAGSYIIYYDGEGYHFRTDGKIPGTVLSADSAINSINAIKSIQDGKGQQIDTTYIKDLSVSGRVITYTKGDGITDTITTQDTTYTSLKNPYSIILQGNGKTLENGVYDGSNEKIVNITPETIGAADLEHIHTIANIINLQSTLDSKASLIDGKVPAVQLPSYVDDVIEGYLYDSKFYSTKSGQDPNFIYSGEVIGEVGKIYVNLDNNKTYRWGGNESGYVEISESLALGETETTAYPGNKGKELYDHYGSGVIKGSPKKPIYINNGIPTQCDDTLDNNITGNAETATTATKLGTENIGNGTNLIYLNEGIPTESVSNVGSFTKPVYLNNGELSPIDVEIKTINSPLDYKGWSILGGKTDDGWDGLTISHNSAQPDWLSEMYSSTLLFGCNNTKGYIDVGQSDPMITFGGGSTNNSTEDNPNWYIKLLGTNGKTYTLPAETKTLAASDGSNAFGTEWEISITGNAATATNLDSNRNFVLNGDVTGSISSNLSSGLDINTTSSRIVGYGICSTNATVSEKDISILNDKWTREVGSIIGIKFINSNDASNVTLNVNSTGAAPIWYNTDIYLGSSANVCGYAGRYHYYMWDGTYWVWLNYSLDANDDTFTSAYCDSLANNPEKTAIMTDFVLRGPSYIHLTLTTTNTAISNLTLDINETGPKPIYINGAPSSSNNYNLPAGSYLVYYDGENYHFRTDAKLQSTLNSDLSMTVMTTDTNSEVPKNYNITWVEDEGPQSVKINNGITYTTLEDIDLTPGYSILCLGNELTSGIEGNKYGKLKLFGQNNYYAQITPQTTLNNVDLVLPSLSGLLARTDDNVASATKLETERKINGTFFDGTKDIVTNSWGTERTLIIGSAEKHVDGSESVAWTHGEIGVSNGGHINYLLPSETSGWIRIASSPMNILNCNGLFTIVATSRNSHTVVTVNATTSYGSENSTLLTCLNCGQYGTKAITKVRVVYHTSFSGNYAHIEVYKDTEEELNINIDVTNLQNWILAEDFEEGDFPEGYNFKEININNENIVTNGTIKSDTQIQVGSLAWVKETDGSYSLKMV